MSALTPERLAEVQSEHGQQVALFCWAALPATRFVYTGIDSMFAIPNGGERNAKVAANLKAEGVRAGVADIFLPVPLDGSHGLWIEMKWGKNKPTDEQEEFLRAMHERGYVTALCYSFEEAKQVIIDYYAGR